MPAGAALPEDLPEELPRLESLMLASCGLEALPAALLAMTSLRLLDLQSNGRLAALPEEIAQLTRWVACCAVVTASTPPCHLA